MLEKQTIKQLTKDASDKLDELLKLYTKTIGLTTSLLNWAEKFLVYRKIVKDIYTAHSHTMHYQLGFEKATVEIFRHKMEKKLDEIMPLSDFELILQIFQLTQLPETPLTENDINSYEQEIKQFEKNNSKILTIVKNAQMNCVNLKAIYNQFNEQRNKLTAAISKQIDDIITKLDINKDLAKTSLQSIQEKLDESNTHNLINLFTNKHLRSVVPEITEIYGIESLVKLNGRNDITESNMKNLDDLYSLSKNIPASVFDPLLTTEQIIKCLIQSLQLETKFENLKHSSIISTLTRSEKTSSSQDELSLLQSKSISTSCITPLTISIETPRNISLGTPHHERGKYYKHEKKTANKHSPTEIEKKRKGKYQSPSNNTLSPRDEPIRQSHHKIHKHKHKNSSSTLKPSKSSSSTKQVITNLHNNSGSSFSEDKQPTIYPFLSSSDDEDNNKSIKQASCTIANNQQSAIIEKQHKSSEYKNKTWSHFQSAKDISSNPKYKTLATPPSSPRKNNK